MCVCSTTPHDVIKLIGSPPMYSISSLLTHMVYLLRLLSYLAVSKNVSAHPPIHSLIQPRYDDKYHSRSYCFVERKKFGQILQMFGCRSGIFQLCPKCCVLWWNLKYCRVSVTAIALLAIWPWRWTANQSVHLCGVDKLVAIADSGWPLLQIVNVNACGCMMACIWHMQPVA